MEAIRLSLYVNKNSQLKKTEQNQMYQEEQGRQILLFNNINSVSFHDFLGSLSFGEKDLAIRNYSDAKGSHTLQPKPSDPLSVNKQARSKQQASAP